MTTYSEIPAVNFSSLKHFDRGALHYKAGLARKFKQTPTMAMGSMVHTLVLELDRFADRYCISDLSRNSNAYRELARMEADAGREVVKTNEVEKARLIAGGVKSNSLVEALLNGAEFEKTLTWNMHGFDCKGRVDALRVTGKKPVLIDLKTTADPQPWAFGKQVYDMKYHAQMAFYASGMVAELGCAYPEVYLIAVQNTEPFECVVYQLPLPVLDAGEQMYMKWLDALRQCREDDRYGSSYEGVNELVLPAYAYPDEDDDVDMSGIGGAE